LFFITNKFTLEVMIKSACTSVVSLAECNYR